MTIWFNAIEAALWIAIGFGCGVRAMGRDDHRPAFWTLCAGFILFGLSDIIEIQTGAWWRPWWLLVLKSICLATIALPLWILWKSRRGGDEGES